MTILVLCTIASLVLYYMAPVAYSYTFSIACTAIFFVSCFVLLKNNCKYTLIKFEFFFLFAFFFTNFVYAVFYYPINPYFSLFAEEFNEDYINKGAALSALAASCFCLGVYDKKPERELTKQTVRENLNAPIPLVNVLLLLFIPYLFALYGTHQYVTDFTKSNLNAILLYMVYYIIFAIMATRKISIKSSASRPAETAFFFLTGIMVLLLLMIGSRSNPVHIVLLMLFLYNFYQHKIGNKMALLVMLVGVLAMGFVGVVRGGSEFSTSDMGSLLDIGNDLTINNRSLYVLMEYADGHGFTFGRTMLLQIAAIIPWGQSMLLSIPGISIQMVDSSSFVTWLYYGNQKFEIGFGTNLIGDIYLAFGLFGVIVLMFLYGRILRKIYNSAIAGSGLATLVYGLMFMETIFLTRAGLLTSLRPIAWTLLYYYLFNYLFAKNQPRKKI